MLNTKKKEVKKFNNNPPRREQAKDNGNLETQRIN